MRIPTEKKPAFTMIELIFVIIILGITASIGSSIIAKLFENYLLQRATHRASLKTEIAAQQIANLLSYRIPNTTLARNPNSLNDAILVTEVDPTLGGVEDNIHTALEWIGTDNDSFTAAIKPGWSGFCDVNASSQTAIITPGSNLNLAKSIIANLSSSSVNLSTNTTPNVAIFFRDILYTKNPDTPYDIKTCMGMLSTSSTNCISTVQETSPTALSFVQGSGNTQKVITEHYKLAWTAYAIVPIKPNTDQTPCAQGETPCDLKLFYNYQPWGGTRLSFSGSISHATIIPNVTVFKFAKLGSTLRFKVCAQENIGEDDNVTICKEKAVTL